MTKPSLFRALVMGALGFVLGLALVLVIRLLQNMDPTWDAGIGLIVGGFMAMGFSVWGIGAFDPRMNQHAHPPTPNADGIVVAAEPPPPFEDDAGAVSLERNALSRALERFVTRVSGLVVRVRWTEPAWRPGFAPLRWLVNIVWFILAGLVRLLSLALIIPAFLLGVGADVLVWLWRVLGANNGVLWKVGGLALISLIVLFSIALLNPLGLRLDTVNDANASAAANGYSTLELFGTTFEISQLTYLVLFMIVVFVSLALIAGLLALLFYGLNHQVKRAQASEPDPEALQPPTMVREVGGFFGWLVRVFDGIPDFFGYK
jgi:hypothetical protein